MRITFGAHGFQTGSGDFRKARALPRNAASGWDQGVLTMHDPRLSVLFARYRREGDLAALAKLFDEIAPEMMRVARHVAGRGVDPEDVVQATFLASIERSEAFDEQRPIVPWLMGILINQARLMNRRRATRHEESAVYDLPDDAHEPDDAEAREVQDAVARALADLPPTYKEVLIAHLAEGKLPHEIARDLGRPQGTVRAQLHRGLRIIRRSLPTGFALGFAAMLDRSALAGVRREVLESAARAKSQPTSAIPSSTATWHSSVGVGVASVVLAVVVLVAWVGGKSVQADPELALDIARPQGREALQSAEPGARRSVAVSTVGSAAPTTVPAQSRDALPGNGSVRVVVRDALGAVVPAVHVDLLAWGDPLWHERVRALVTDENGVAEFARVPVGRVGVHLDGGGVQSRADVMPDAQVEVAIELERGLDLVGTVVDPRGLPVQGAVVEVGEDPSVEPRRTSAPTGPDGRFTLRNIERSLTVWARADSRPASDPIWFGTPSFGRSARAEVHFVVGEPTTPIEFTVVNARGDPIDSATAVAFTASGDGEHGDGERGDAIREAVFRQDGALALTGGAARARSSSRGLVRLTADRERVEWIAISAPGHASREMALADVGTLVALNVGARLAGVARFDDGVAAEAALVETRVEGLREPLRTRAGLDGAWEIVDVPAGLFTLKCQASLEAEASEVRGTAISGATFDWNPVLEHATVIRGVARSAHGGPAKTWLVKAVREAVREPDRGDGAGEPLVATWLSTRASALRGQELRQCWTGPQDGTFLVPCAKGATYRLELRARAAWNGPVLGALDGVRAGATDVDLRVQSERGFVRARFVDSAGRPAAGVLSAVRKNSGAEHRGEAQSDGRVERDLYPGEYTLVAWPEGSAPFSLGVHRIGGDTALDLGDVCIEATGSLTIRGGSGARLMLRSVDGLAYELGRPNGGWFARAVPVGDYSLTGWRADGTAVDARVRVEAGKAQSVDLD